MGCKSCYNKGPQSKRTRLGYKQRVIRIPPNLSMAIQKEKESPLIKKLDAKVLFMKPKQMLMMWEWSLISKNLLIFVKLSLKEQIRKSLECQYGNLIEDSKPIK